MEQAKQKALEAIKQLPDNVDMDEIMYRLYVIDKVNKGKDAAGQGKLTHLDELEREISSW